MRYRYGDRVTHKDGRTGTVTKTPALATFAPTHGFPVRFDGSDGPDFVMAWDLRLLEAAKKAEASAIYD
jgi:hypothetical protein